MMILNFNLPVYIWITKKKKQLLSLNQYRNNHFHVNNEIKRKYKELVMEAVDFNDIEPYKRYSIELIYNYRNRKSDLSNVCSVITKYLEDALVELNWLSEDTVQNCRDIKFITGDYNKNYPNIEVIVTLKGE